MGYLAFWIITFLIGTFQVAGNQGLLSKEILDFTTVYRTPESGYSSKITKEFHRWENSKEMLLKSGYEYIDLMEDMAPLNCAPASETCKWTLSSGWSYIDVDVNEDKPFTIDVGNIVLKDDDRCARDNGGCNFLCRTANGKPQCYCPKQYAMMNDTSCEWHDPQISEYSVKRINTTGSFYIYSWVKSVFIPPKATKLNMTITYKGRNPAIVYELTEDHRREEFVTIRSTAHIHSTHMLEVSVGFAMSLAVRVNFVRQHLTLVEENGSLSYEIYPVSDIICVSVIYRSPHSKENIIFNVNLANGTKYEVSNYTERQFGEWKIKSFAFSLGKGTRGKVKLQLDITGKGIMLHSIFGCSPYGDRSVAVIRNEDSIPNVSEELQDFKDAADKCYNGGVYIPEVDKCVCPEGFTGVMCEEGCGPYYFGNNCSTECSNFVWGCSGMIFCKTYLPCLCAPGYRGKQCHQSCSMGFYGPSCKQACGQCTKGSCDRFTGYCHAGCKQGFIRPFCQIPYKYSPVSPIITFQDLCVATAEIHETVPQSKYYQIQYKKEEDIFWTELQLRELENTPIKTNISNLTPGTSYHVRVVYIGSDGNSYQGSMVPATFFESFCTVPTSDNYNVKIETTISTSSSISVSWKYVPDKGNCPITGYTTILRRSWSKIERNVTWNQQDYIFQDLLPGILYEVKIRAITRFGEGPFSSSFVKTSDNAPLHVSDLRVSEIGSKKLRLSWKPPRFTGGLIKEYWVRYQCIRFWGCEESCSDINNQTTVEANTNFVNFDGLQSHVQYLLEVAAKSESIGPYTSVEGLTQDSVPDAAPEMHKSPMMSSTNTSIAVQWLPLKNCCFLNGFLVGYRYALFSTNHTLLMTGETVNRHITFNHLIPQTLYFVHVHAISTGGWNENEKLVINASTAASVPDRVQNLAIYKRGRRLLGVRWAPPINSYGEVESFSVSYCQLNNCANAVSVRVAAVPCVPWPSLFCHTINGLSPNSQYSVSVRARNIIVHEYGIAATIIAATSEGVPEAPLALRMLSRTSESVTLEWKPPNIFNGVLRSFLINFEHIESANTSFCCEYFPLQEILVRTEEEKYFYQVTGLIPASKYIIGVSAKTITIGPSAFLSLATPPEITEVIHPPKLIKNNRVKIHLGGSIPGTNGTYLLLVLLPNGNSSPLIWDLEVAEELQNIVNTNSFYIVDEFSAEDVQSMMEIEETMQSIEVEIGKGVAPRNGTIGVLEDPVLPSKFNVGLALVLSYNGASSVGFSAAEEEAIKSDNL